MEIKDKIWLGCSVLFALMGTLFAVIAWNSWHATSRIVQGGIQTQGIVVENRHRPVRGLQTQTSSLAPVVQFVTAEGRTVQYFSQTYTTPAMYQPGQAVNIWYLPDDPQQATLDGLDAGILPLVFGIFAAALCLIGYPALIKALFRRFISPG